MTIELPRRSPLSREIGRPSGRAKEVMDLATRIRISAGHTHKRGENYTNPSEKQTLALKGDPDRRDTSKYCAFHGTHGHTTNNCFAWKAHLEELVREGHCTEFIAKQAIQQIEDRDTAKEPPQKVIRINTILADSEESGLTSKEKKKEDQTSHYDLLSLNRPSASRRRSCNRLPKERSNWP
ncbi:unnamed protein product [Prunus armeniaca]